MKLICCQYHIDALLHHARKACPREACGLLIGKDTVVEHVCPMQNIAVDTRSFMIDPDEQLKIMHKIVETEYELIGVYHSHIDSDAIPSMEDRGNAPSLELIHCIVSLCDMDAPNIQAYFFSSNEYKEIDLTIMEDAYVH